MSPTITATIGLVSLLLCTLSAALPAPSNSLGHSASFRHHHRRLVLLPSQDRPLNRNDALTANSSSAPAPSINPVAVLPDTNSAQTTTSGTKLDLTKVDTWIALQAEMEALEQAEVSASATTNDLNFDDLVTDEDCDPDLAALLDSNTTSTSSSNLTLSGTPNATVSKNVSTGVISASPSPHIDLVSGNATVQRGTVKADKDSDESQKQKQDTEESLKKAKQAAEENRKKVAQDAEENRKKVEQDAEESRKKAEQDAEESRKKAEQDAEEEKTQKEAEKAAAAAKKSAEEEEASKKSEEEEEASKKSSEEEEASKKAADEAEAARKKAADEAKKAADASVAQVKKDEEAKKAEEGKKDDKSSEGYTKSSEGYTAPTGHSTGDATFYGTGLGACGVTNKDSDYICAVSKLLFDEFPAPGGNPNLSEVCGKKITATYKGKSVTVTVQDRCEACKHDDLDFSPEAFNQIGHPDQGRLNGMTWTWA